MSLHAPVMAVALAPGRFRLTVLPLCSPLSRGLLGPQGDAREATACGDRTNRTGCPSNLIVGSTSPAARSTTARDIRSAHREHADDEPAGDGEVRTRNGDWSGQRRKAVLRSGGKRDGLAAVRQWRASACRLSGETPAHSPDDPPAAAGNTVQRIRRGDFSRRTMRSLCAITWPTFP
jgi:hypothetical protein